MAQTGYTPISLYYSSTSSNTPTAGNLVAGELAINTADGKLFYKDSAGVVQVIGTKGGVGSSTTTQVLYNSSGLVVGSANMTFNGTGLTLANDASISGLTVGKGGGSVTYNAVFGASSIPSGATGAYNTAIGSTNALAALTTGQFNTAVGSYALAANTSAYYNTAVGHQAGTSNTTGSVTAVGTQVLYANTTGVSNVGMGGSDNNGGTPALRYNTTGSYNTAIGGGALQANTTASGNTAVGYQAGYSNTTGTQIVAIGQQALQSGTTASYSTIVGYYAGQATTGTLNTFIGNTSGYLVTSGSKNSILGAYSGNQGGLDIRTSSNYIVLSDGDGNPRAYWNTNGTLQATANASNDNAAYVINSSATNPYGFQVSFSNAAPNNTTQRFLTCGDTVNDKAVIYTNGTVTNRTGTYNAFSDAKLKENIVDATPKLDKLMDVKVRNYNLIGDELKQIGFVAQELEQVFPNLIDNVPDLDESKQPTGEVTKGVKLTVMIPILVKAIQELKAEFDAYKSTHP
jgi:hypothetical protein